MHPRSSHGKDACSVPRDSTRALDAPPSRSRLQAFELNFRNGRRFNLQKPKLAAWLIGVAIVFISPFACGQTVAPSTRALITGSVDEARLVPLPGNTRPEATTENDRGAVADGFPLAHLLLQLRRPPEQESTLEQLLDDLQDPKSPNFHKWLKPQQFGQSFGVAQQDLDAITQWLQSHGFTVNSIYPSRTLIDVSGTAGQVREAFHTEIHNLDVNGITHIANMSNPQIPEALAPVIVGIVSLHDFKPRGMHEMRKPPANYTTGSRPYAVVPADLATIYNLNPLFTAGYSGQGQTIAVIEDTDVFSTSDWDTFRSTFGLSTYAGSFSTTHPAPQSGANNCSDPGVIANIDSEAIIDAEWASAAAPSAAIQLASCADTFTTFGGLIALQNLINANSPPALVSISYGECEAENGSSANAAYNAAYQQAVSEGTSVFVSAGDSGAADCDDKESKATHGIGVNALASTPYNVAMGGTDFSDTSSGTNSSYWSSTNTATYGSALSYIPEIPWNDSCASLLLANYSGSGITYSRDGFCNTTQGESFLTTTAGSGGPSACATGSPTRTGIVSGTCQGWPKPSWQSALSNFGNPNDGVRDLPDLSLFASQNSVWGHYYIVCWSDPDGGAPCTGAPSGWSGFGGTSFTAPIMAGIQALVNQKTGQSQGNPNPTYYQLAASEYNLNGSGCNSSNGNGVASTCVFYDVTQGDMDVNCTDSHNCYLDSATNGVLSTLNNSYNPAYGATTGWDFATGIGSVSATNLVNNWPIPPPGPTLVSANAVSSTEIDLSWTNPASSNATGNSVLRCTGSTCAPTIAIASVSATSTTYEDTSVSPLTAYTYIIEATNSVSSTNSNSLSATTPPLSETPVASLSAINVQFVPQRLRTTSAAQTVTLSNTGTATLNITSITLTGANPGDFAFVNTSTCPTGMAGGTLAAGAGCTIVITATPLAPGPRTSSISISDNVAGSPQTIVLAAFGVGTLDDFDGNGKSDIAVWRPSNPDGSSNGTWYIIPSSNPGTPIVQSWGLNGDMPVPGDYDGDGKTDFAVWRSSTGQWFIIPSSNPGAPIVQSWGLPGDIPVPGDYDGDGKTDFAVWRSSTGQWFIIPSSNPGAPIVQSWGLPGDIPVPGDYDGDGKTDFAVSRPSTGTWYILPSSNPGAPIVQSWGLPGDIPVPGDYDGDGKTDFAVWRPSTGTWYILPSSNPGTPIVQSWGLNGDIPVPGDYFGTGQTDIAVWRPSTGTWYILPPSGSQSAPIVQQWGISTDVPLESSQTFYDIGGGGSGGTPQPFISSLSPSSGAVSTSVTITGTNFGSTQANSTVIFNGTTASPTSWSATMIGVSVPAGATTGGVIVTVAGETSNAVGFTVTTLSPNITSINPSAGPVGTLVTVTGTNFGTSQGASTITFNGTVATPTSWSPTAIVVSVPLGATTGNVTVTVSGLASNGINFTVTAPASSISRTGSCSAATSSCTLSAAATGNLNLFFAYSSGSSTPPSLPSGYTSIATGNANNGGTTGSYLLYCKVASSPFDTSSGTAQNASAVAGVSYTGTTVDTLAVPGTDCPVTGVSILVQNSAASSTTITYGGLTVENPNNWIVAFLGDSAGSACTSSNLTGVSSAGGVAVSDSNGTVSSFSQGTCSVTSSTWISVVLQVRGADPIPASSPGLYRSWGYAGTSGNNGEYGNPWYFALETSGPRQLAAGHLLLLYLKYPSPGVSVSSVTDNGAGGGNSYSLETSCSDSNHTYAVYYTLASEPATQIQVNFSAAVDDFQAVYRIYDQISSSSPFDGPGECTTGITPTNDQVSNVQAGVYTTSINNDLIDAQFWDSVGTTGASAQTYQEFGSGFTGLYADPVYGGLGEYATQSTAGAINPGAGYASSSLDTYAAIVVAIEQGSSGPLPGSGIGIVRSEMFYDNGLPSPQLVPLLNERKLDTD